MVPRGFRSNGQLDANVCANLLNAQSGGIPTREVYLFPCPTCSSTAYNQLSTLVNQLKAYCPTAWTGNRIWLDIEGIEYWTTSYSTNKAFYQSLVDACSSLGISCGIYSSQYQWSSIFGSSLWCYGPDTSMPVWYSHYDGNPSFDDYYSKYYFGCWTDFNPNPLAKQYQGTTSVCGASVDLNSALM